MSQKAATQQIVLAWAEQTALVPTGRHVMRDMNWFPEFRTDWEGKAAMWTESGSAADLEKAEALAASDNRHVFTFPPDEKEPLARARELAVEMARKCSLASTGSQT